MSPPADPTPAPGYCPSGWEELDGSCYRFDASVRASSWDEAEADCQKKYGASLVSIHTSTEEDFVMKMADETFSTSAVWIGMERDGKKVVHGRGVSFEVWIEKYCLKVLKED